MKPVGRPPQVDINGEPIKKCLLNVTIPVELADFLRREGTNRSKLFTTAVSALYTHQICSTCYSKDITESQIGMHCKPCARYDHKAGWYHLKRCPVCKKQYKPGVNVPLPIKGSDKWNCQECQE